MTLFSRYLKNVNPPSGSSSDQVKIDKRYEHLRWLITFIKARLTTGNNKSLQIMSSAGQSGPQERTCNDDDDDEGSDLERTPYDDDDVVEGNPEASFPGRVGLPSLSVCSPGPNYTQQYKYSL